LELDGAFLAEESFNFCFFEEDSWLGSRSGSRISASPDVGSSADVTGATMVTGVRVGVPCVGGVKSDSWREFWMAEWISSNFSEMFRLNSWPRMVIHVRIILLTSGCFVGETNST
jgi:hypothetical protein